MKIYVWKLYLIGTKNIKVWSLKNKVNKYSMRTITNKGKINMNIDEIEYFNKALILITRSVKEMEESKEYKDLKTFLLKADSNIIYVGDEVDLYFSCKNAKAKINLLFNDTIDKLCCYVCHNEEELKLFYKAKNFLADHREDEMYCYREESEFITPYMMKKLKEGEN